MLSLLSGSFVLALSRLGNYAVIMISPLLLVRMIDVQAYGEYREFLLYASVLAGLLGCAIKDNLIYIIPRRPEQSRAAVAQTNAMLLLMSVAGTAVFLVGAPWFMSRASFDFTLPLVAFVLLFLNFDILENYWLARQQATLVLVFSAARTVLRLAVVLIAAYFYGTTDAIIIACLVAEALKVCVSLFLLGRMGLLWSRVDRRLLKEQLAYIIPLSGAGLIFLVNEKAGHVFVSATLGSAALAVYTIGTYQLPVMGIVRSAVSDTLFPEMVRSAAADKDRVIDLWRRATLYYVAIVLPLWVPLFFFSETIVTTLFTAQYADAVPIFQVALFIMLRQCFEMGTPLRAINANRHMLVGNLLALAVHLPVLYVLIAQVGLVGAALAWIVADLTLSLYLVRVIMRHYGLRLHRFALWRPIAALAACGVLALPVLFVGTMLPGHPLVAAMGVGFLYAVTYFVLIKLFKIQHVDTLIRQLQTLVLRRLRLIVTSASARK